MSILGCDDCGTPYREFALDVVLPDDQWQAIYGRPGGVLCGGCIVARGSKLPGVTVAKLHFPDLRTRPLTRLWWRIEDAWADLRLWWLERLP